MESFIRLGLAVATIGLGVSSLTGCSIEKIKAPFRFSFDKANSTDLSTSQSTALSSADAEVARDLSEFKTLPLDINMLDTQGQPLRLSDYHGKIVVVDIWGTWCGPCRRVIPHLVSMQAKHPADLQVIGLCNERTADLRTARSQLTRAVEDFGINYPCTLIDDQWTRKIPNFSGYPTMLFVDRDGKVRMSTVGVKSEAYYDALVNQLLAEPPQTQSPSARTASAQQQSP